jgi:hypothetical protein
MKTRFASALLSTVFATAAFAQQSQPTEPPRPPTPPGAPMQPGQPGMRPAARPAQPAGPQGESKLRWVMRQLKLDKTQNEQAEALITVYHAEMKDLEANAAELLQKIQDKFAEVQAAKAAGDDAKVKQLQDELRNMAPSVQAENSFFTALGDLLSPEQKEKLPQLRKQVETIGDVSLRPIHVIRATKDLQLTGEQSAKLEKLISDYRDGMGQARPENQQAQNERVEQLVVNVRAILTDGQAVKFDALIEEARFSPAPKPAAAPAGAFQPPATRPAVPPAPPAQP